MTLYTLFVIVCTSSLVCADVSPNTLSGPYIDKQRCLDMGALIYEAVNSNVQNSGKVITDAVIFCGRAEELSGSNYEGSY